jgi:hypothetical protein
MQPRHESTNHGETKASLCACSRIVRKDRVIMISTQNSSERRDTGRQVYRPMEVLQT